MPSLSTYRNMLGNVTEGQAHKIESDAVIEETWNNSLEARVAYLYSYEYDVNKGQLNNLNSPKDENKIPIDVKYIRHTSQTLVKDNVSYHIMLRPSQECNVPYYENLFEKRYDATFPVGLYIDIPDRKGQYNRWLVVARADFNDAQFATFDILRCDYVFDYVYKSQKIKMAGVLRSQNSYNSGVWTDYRFTGVEDQQKALLPLNSNSELIYYNQRMIIDSKVDVNRGAEPRAWKVTKINRVKEQGIVNLTFAQDYYNQATDVVEYEDPNDPTTITGMWADLNAVPDPHDVPVIPVQYTAEITYSGIDPNIKVGGSYKKLTVRFYDNEAETEYQDGEWGFTIDDEDVSELITVLTSEDDANLAENQIRATFTGDSSYIGKVLTVTYTATDSGTVGKLLLSIIGL